MYLKSIEIHGFKSFANKMLFEFQDGITGIVGPNGSGKSNVSDAVRWVLGEQSAKQLRGSKMEDVIFAGTEARKPLGFAYVAITLDNSDHKLPTSYEEVTVARRVYRSGESEYLLNGAMCRLKDVQELFMDTGIGKEGYSIIGQGQIDRILSGKPEERRELFDEAAGIVKYKRRKAAAEKNLEAERQNLCRIRDIIAELEKQVIPLEKQSETARKYLKYKEELKALDIDLFFKEFDRIKGIVKETQDKDKITADNLAESKHSFDAMRAEYEKLEEDINQKMGKLEQDKNTLNVLRLEKEQSEGKVKVFEEQIHAIEQSEEYYKERREKLLAQIQGKKQNVKEQERKIDAMKLSLEEKKQSSSTKETVLRESSEKIKMASEKIETLNQKIFDIRNSATTYKAQIQHFQAMQEQVNLKHAELNQRLLKVKSSEAVYNETIEQEEAFITRVTEQITGYQNVNESIEGKLIDYSNKILAARTKMQTVTQQANMENAKLASLRNMTERYDGYGQSIKRVMEQKNKEPGIIGVVADIIKVKKEYETAIEIALGGSIQNIVTDNEDTAKRLIEYLKKNRFGRATFLPLTLIESHGRFAHSEALKEPGVIGLASTLIEADQKFSGVVSHLLGRVVVTKTIDDAIILSRKYRSSLRIVTLEGELLNPGGAMSGGAFKNSSNLLSRRREIETMEQNLEKLKGQIASFENKMQELIKEKEEREAKLKSNQEKLQELMLNWNTSKVKLSQAKEGKQSLSNDFLSIQKENMELDRQKEEWIRSIKKLEEQLSSSEEEKTELKQDLKETQERLEGLRKEEGQLRQKVSSFQIEYSKLEQSQKFMEETRNRLAEEAEALSRELENMAAIQEDSKTKILKKQEEIQSLRQMMELKQIKIEEIIKAIKELEQAKEETAKNHKGIFTKRDALSEEIILLEKEHARLAAQKDKLDEQLEHLKNYMWEEYELTFNSAYALKTESQALIQDLKKQIAEKKNEIRGLGEVNVNAIEDYKNLSKRYELLNTQHNDLVESEAALVDIIHELDIEMQNQFQEKFKDIQYEFDKAFKELFGGGKGTLELVDTDDILETGIQIIAQPPGKKLQNMMQLSGGEKALTAIALLFAIQNLKPSPFCLLDEIEAALDDSNVSRFAKYLHKLTKHTQFIVITHRRGTMESADVLYGITMQEKGISALVSVNLIENELEN